LHENNPCASIIELELLPVMNMASIVKNGLKVRELPPVVVKVIREKCRGHPLYAEELIKVLGNEDIMRIENKRLVPEASAEEILAVEVQSEAVQAAVMGRIDALPAPLQVTAKLVAVIGGDISTHMMDLLNTIHPRHPDTETLLFLLDELVKASLLVKELDLERDVLPNQDPPMLYRFKHQYICDTVCDILPLEQKDIMHQTAAKYLLERLAFRKSLRLPVLPKDIYMLIKHLNHTDPNQAAQYRRLAQGIERAQRVTQKAKRIASTKPVATAPRNSHLNSPVATSL
jgi:predicted ATPase